MPKPIVSVLCGGQSAEHSVSLISARTVASALREARYNVRVIYITRDGKWFLIKKLDDFINSLDEDILACPNVRIGLALGDHKAPWLSFDAPFERYETDVVFPVLHGSFGEDGRPQGLLGMAEVPYVGCGTLSSAICMDKDTARRLVTSHQVEMTPAVTLHRDRFERPQLAEIVETLGLPVMVKPSESGSSIGMSKVYEPEALLQAIDLAFKCDRKVLVEKVVIGKEIECAVFGLARPEAAYPGELEVHSDFYDYNAKYLDAHGASLHVPARIDQELAEQVKEKAVEIFQILECEGMARIDFFIEEGSNRILFNEANTIPGFTPISLYPKCWELAGLSMVSLCDSLVGLAFEQYHDFCARSIEMRRHDYE